MIGPQSARPKKTATMSDPSRRTRFEGRQGDTAAHESVCGTFETCQRPTKTSVYRVERKSSGQGLKRRV
jgi:hypothetical protein